MRKLIITLVLTAFIVTLSSPILIAAQWDPATGPNWPERRFVERVDVSGDDTPWAEESKSTSVDNRSYLIFILNNYLLNFFIFIDFSNIDQSEEETTQNYNGRQN